MEIRLLDQIGGFGAFCLFGAVLGVYYTAYKLLRYFIRFSRWAIFFQDILFFVTSAVATFILLMNIAEGEVRGYILLGVLIGFSVYYFTLGALVFSVGKFLIDVIKKTHAFIDRIIISPVRKVLRSILKKTLYLVQKGFEWEKRIAKKTFCRMKKNHKKSNIA